jgi:hypothetical protein
MDNLISLCPRHHHVIHKAGWQIVGDPNFDVQFIRDGRVYPGRSPDISPKVKKRIDKIIKRHRKGESAPEFEEEKAA